MSLESSHGGSDESPHLATPSDHSGIQRGIEYLHSSIDNIFNTAVENVGSEIAQQKQVSQALLNEALDQVKSAAFGLAELDIRYVRIDATHGSVHWREEARLREAHQSGQSTTEFSERIAQIRDAHQEALSNVNESIRDAESHLRLVLENFERVITETFKGLPEALEATEPEELTVISGSESSGIGQWDPKLEAGLLDAKLLIARMDLEALRERLRPTDSQPAENRSTDSPTANLALGSINLQTFLAMERESDQRTLGNVIRLYHFVEQEPDNFFAREQFSILSDALDVIPGDTALEKTDKLCFQRAFYNHPEVFQAMAESFGVQEIQPVNLLNEEEVRVRYGMLQFDIPLSRLWRSEEG